jgi:hypothetical protein
MGESGLIESLIFVVVLFVRWIADNADIEDDGARHILHGLEKNTSLTELVIWGAFLLFIVHLLSRLLCMLESL